MALAEGAENRLGRKEKGRLGKERIPEQHLEEEGLNL